MVELKPVKITLEVSPFLHRYLEYLATHSILGVSVEDVATYLLIYGADKRFRADYHTKRVPRAAD